MSWQKYSIQFILGLPLAMPIVSYAINIGDTYIQSQQNQPLQASINVSDIDPKTFSVQLSSPSIYQQLGLAKEDSIAVRFEPTSSNGGRIVLTSQRPIAAPFTDVVLDVANKGELRVLPKTLLMPLNDAQRIVTQPSSQLVAVPTKKVTIGTDSRVRLPVIGQPLRVINAEPPPMDVPSALPNRAPDQSAPITVSATSVTPAVVTPNTPQATGALHSQANPNHNLVINETRRFYPINAAPVVVTNLETLTSPEEAVSQKVAATTPNPPAHPSRPTVAKAAKTIAPTVNQSNEPAITYVIQRNDNLWTIADRLAQQQNRDVGQVMQAIVANNPHAFVNNDPSQMIANSKLVLPTYATTPSKTAIKAAQTLSDQRRTAQRKATKQPSTNTAARLAKLATKSTKAPLTTRKATKTAKATSNPLANAARRRSEMTIIAPAQRNGAAQGGTQDTKRQRTSVSAEQVQKLQQKRQLIAKKSRSVSELDKTLSSAEQGLKVQNARLAQLEQQLKRLNNP